MHILSRARCLISINLGITAGFTSASAGELLQSGGGTVNVAGASGTLPGITVGDQATLVVTVGAEFGSQLDEVTSVTFAGQSLLPAIQQSQTISSASIWYLANPPATTGAVEVTFTSNPAGNQAAISHYTLSGINPSDPLLSVQGTGYPASIEASHSLPVGSGSAVVIDALTTNNRTTSFLWGDGGQTEGPIDYTLGRGTATHASHYDLDLSGTQIRQVQWTNTNRAIHVSAAFSTPDEIFFNSTQLILISASAQGAIHTVNAYDPSPGSISYTISETEDLFELNRTSGELRRTGKPIATGQYELTVTATNHQGGAASQDLTIIVNDAPPFINADNVSLSGASGTAGTFKAGDTITARWDNSPGGDSNAGIQSVTMDFSAFGGSPTLDASENEGTWISSYTLPVGLIDLPNAQISITATNVIGPTTVLDNNTYAVDTEPPSVTAENLSLSPGDESSFVNGDIITMTWNDAGGDENLDLIQTVQFDFGGLGGSQQEGMETTVGSRLWEASYQIANNSISGEGLGARVTVTDDAGNTASAELNTALTISGTGIIHHSLPPSSHPGEIRSSFTHLGPAFPAMILVGFAAENGGAAAGVSRIEISVDGEIRELTTNASTGIFDAVGQVGIWYGQVDVLPAGTHEITITTSVDPTRSGTNLWILPGRPAVRDSQTSAYLDDQNGGAFTGGESGSVGFNLNAEETLSRAGDDSAPATLDTENSDFIIAMTLSGNEGGGLLGTTEGWTAYRRDIPFQSGNYSILHGPLDEDGPRLGIELSAGYTRYGLAALALDLDEIIPSGEPFLVELGTGGAGNLLIGAYNLNPARTYVVNYGTEPGDFPRQFGSSVSGVTQAVFTDSDPGENALFQLEEEAAPPERTTPPELVVTGRNSSGHILFEVENLDPGVTYRLKRGNDLQTFPDIVGPDISGVSSASLSDTAPPSGVGFYRIEEQ